MVWCSVTLNVTFVLVAEPITMNHTHMARKMSETTKLQLTRLRIRSSKHDLRAERRNQWTPMETVPPLIVVPTCISKHFFL